MTAALVAIASFAVGASGPYPALRIQEEHGREGAEGQSHAALRTLRWTIHGAAQAANDAALAALVAALEAALTTRGVAVTITELGGTPRTMPAPGAGGSLPGWPRTAFRTLPDASMGVWQEFEVIAETRVPVGGAGGDANLVMHDWTRTIEDAAGSPSTRQRGSVRVVNGFAGGAAAWIESNVLDAARDAAQTAGRRFTSRVTVRADAASAEYEYADEPPAAGQFGGPGVTAGEVIDRTETQREGRRVRTVSGHFVGTGASALAEAQRPAGGDEFIARETISAPRQPDGRVDFHFESLKGATDGAFPGAVLFAYDETIAQVAGGRSMRGAAFANRAPIVWQGDEDPYVYEQRTRIDYRGTHIDPDNVPPLLAIANRVGRPVVSRSTRGGVHSVTVSQAFAFTAPVATLPAPKEVVGL